MTFRLLAAAALSFGLSVAAQAQPSLNPAASAPAKPAAVAAPVKPAVYRTAQYSGHAGPGGCKIDRIC